MVKIVKNKMKADVVYKSKYAIENDVRVVCGTDSGDCSVVHVKPQKGSDWLVDYKDSLLTLEEYGAGFKVIIPTHNEYNDERVINLDYSDAYHLLVALTAEFQAKNHELELNWTKMTDDFLNGVVRV